MELKNNKPVWAALATLGLTAVAAGATVLVKMCKKRRLQQEQEENSPEEGNLTPEQEMVYNDAVRAFISLNDRIYELRSQHKELQPLILWLATEGERPEMTTDDPAILELANDIQKFLDLQVPFINACINTISDDGTTFADYMRAAEGKPFDSTLDVEHSGTDVPDGSIIKQVLRLGYFFPESRIANHPVKSIVLV